MSATIAFVNPKGGTGKTTACINIAASLAARGKKVLVVDADPLGAATPGLGVVPRPSRTLYDALCSRRIDLSTLETCEKGVFLLPSTPDLAGAEVELARMDNRENVLKDALARMREPFDFVFVDSPPSVGLLSVNAIEAADSLIVPVTADYFALEALGRFFRILSLMGKADAVTGIAVFGVGRSLAARQAEDEMRKWFGSTVFETVIPKSARVAEAGSYGVSVGTHAPGSKGAAAFDALADEFLARVQTL